MLATLDNLLQDVMQVCRHGHVVTDRLHSCPEQGRYHCERCGATTLHACPTCGQEISGAVVVPGLEPIGTCQPPLFCSRCGAAFPWSHRDKGTASVPAMETLEDFLRRLPNVIRQLRQRWGTRTPFHVDDEHDLEDVIRALLPMHFDQIRPQSRTPSYAPDTRTDFLLHPLGIVCVAKRTSLELREAGLERQIREDVNFYGTKAECRNLCICVYDPQRYLLQPRELENVWSRPKDVPDVHCVISG